MHDDASPFFIGPHRFDAPDDDVAPVLDRRHELVPDPGERVLWRHRLHAAGYLLGPTEAWQRWALPAAVSVTVTDRRIAYAGSGWQLAVVGGARDNARHRRRARTPGLVSGQIRWQWPSRLELVPAGPDRPARLLVVCDALRTIWQPALALAGPVDEVTELARQVRRSVATFRLTRPQLVDLSPAERDVLRLRAGGGPLAGDGRITLPGSLPVEFRSRDDYYHPTGSGSGSRGPAAGAACGRR